MIGTSKDLRWMWLGAAFVVTGLSQLATQLLVGRILGAGSFGEVATLLNVMTLLGVPMVALQLTVTSLVARGGSMRPTLGRWLAWGLLAGAVAAVTAPAWSGALAVPSLSASRIVALVVPVAIVVTVARGNAVGQSRTRMLAMAMMLAAVTRVVAGVIGAQVWGVPGATSAAVVSEVVLAGALLIGVRARGENRGAVVGRSAAAAAYAQVAMWLIVNVDLLWARRLLGDVDAGRYLLVGGVGLGLVSFGQAFLWHRASQATSPRVGLHIVVRSAAIVTVLSVIAVPVAIVVLPGLLGPSFEDLAPLLVLGGCWAVAASIVHTSLATQIIEGAGGRWRIVPVAAVAVVVPPLATGWFGPSPVVLASTSLLVTALGALVIAWPQVHRERRRRAADRLEARPAVAGVP